MGRARDQQPEVGQPQAPEAGEAQAPEAGEAQAPAGDSAGVYYLSIEAFEARLPRSAPAEPQDEEKP